MRQTLGGRAEEFWKRIRGQGAMRVGGQVHRGKRADI
jgi:hypothetical protein